MNRNTFYYIIIHNSKELSIDFIIKDEFLRKQLKKNPKNEQKFEFLPKIKLIFERILRKIVKKMKIILVFLLLFSISTQIEDNSEPEVDSEGPEVDYNEEEEDYCSPEDDSGTDLRISLRSFENVLNEIFLENSNDQDHSNNNSKDYYLFLEKRFSQIFESIFRTFFPLFSENIQNV